MTLDWLGWSGLTPNEQLSAIGGATVFLSLSTATRVLFGGLALKRVQTKKRKRKRPKAKAKVRR
jgi:hypothetical protein